MKLTIKQKLISSFITVSLLFGVVSAINLYTSNEINKSYEYITGTVSDLKGILQTIQTETASQIGYYQSYLLYGNGEDKKRFEESSAKVAELVATADKIATLEETKKRFDSIGRLNTEFSDAVGLALERADGDKQGAIDQGSQEIMPIADRITEETNALYKYEQEIADVEEADILKSTKTGSILSVTLSVAITLLSALFGILMATQLSKPIRMVMHRMNSIAQGDLTGEPLTTKAKDESGQLVGFTNKMAENMKNLLSRINTVSDTVSSQSEELTQSAAEVRMGTEQAATTMQTIAGGAESQAVISSNLSQVMNGFAHKVQTASGHGEQIQAYSEKVREMTNEGSGLIQTSTSQMENINKIVQDSAHKVENLNEQSKKISQLVYVIKELADQTDLLALNAAIEAARAGEQGRGFSVVADEVKKLAEQTGSSLEGVRDIVANMQNEVSSVTDSLRNVYEEVQQGTVQIEKTNSTFEKIDQSVSRMAGSIEGISGSLSEIAADSQELDSSIQEIASTAEEAAAGIEQTSATVQQTSSSMEEVARSSTDLAKLAEELNSLVQRFKL